MSNDPITDLGEDLEARMQELEDKIETTIAKTGWYAVHVFPDEAVPDADYSFTYSIGFAPAHPEVIVVNLPSRIAHAVLAEIQTRIVAGERFEDGKIYAELLRSYDASFQEVPAAARDEHFRAARRWHDKHGTSFDAIQMCWPDPHGRFPWEPMYEAEACPQRVFGLESPGA